MIEFNGPDFESVDNRILCLKLTEKGLTNAVMFDHFGHVVQPSEILYKKACLIERGSYLFQLNMLFCKVFRMVEQHARSGQT